VQGVAESLARAGRGWGDVSVERKMLRVDDVTAGCEAELRHFLESAVLQASADVPVEDDCDGERSDADQQMTETFRSFAG
jgi:hypothetical protein